MPKTISLVESIEQTTRSLKSEPRHALKRERITFLVENLAVMNAERSWLTIARRRHGPWWPAEDDLMQF